MPFRSGCSSCNWQADARLEVLVELGAKQRAAHQLHEAVPLRRIPRASRVGLAWPSAAMKGRFAHNGITVERLLRPPRRLCTGVPGTGLAPLGAGLLLELARDRLLAHVQPLIVAGLIEPLAAVGAALLHAVGAGEAIRLGWAPVAEEDRAAVRPHEDVLDGGVAGTEPHVFAHELRHQLIFRRAV